MKNLIVVATSVLLVAACGSTPKNEYDRQAENIKAEKKESNKVIKKKMPDWFNNLPTVNNAILAQGIGTSKNLSSAIDKAKMDAYKSICIGKNGRVSMNKESFSSDVNGTALERFESAIKASCDKVEVRGVELAKIDKIEPLVTEHLPNGDWVAFALIALPTGDANVLQTEHNKMELSKDAAKRADSMFSKMQD